ncbi:polysaccharide pyruvyl transferase family protein [Proteus terrae]|uniref:polysaccharide pyruvyl transferase family protein n=1 Tax=Proteus terrae TaxID=1574161 RepID=UPI0038B122E3
MANIILDFYGAMNFGDDLFLKVISDEFPEHKFICVVYDKEKLNILNFSNIEIVEREKLSLPSRMFRKLGLMSECATNNEKVEKDKKLYKKLSQKSDIYVSIGGSIFIEPSTGFNLMHELYEYKLSLFKYSHIIGSNFGPHKTNDFFSKFESIFSKFTSVSFRDEYSFEMFRHLNSVTLASDVVYNLDLSKYNFSKIKDSVGYSLIDLRGREGLLQHSEHYENWIKASIRRDVTNNQKVYLFSFCSAEGDNSIIERVTECLSDIDLNSVTIVNYTGDLAKFIETFGAMEKMYSTRFHASIMSILLEIEFHPIIYSRKTIESLKEFGSEVHYSAIDELKSDLLFNQLRVSENIFKKSKRNFDGLRDSLTRIGS